MINKLPKIWNVTTVVENCKGCEDPLNSISHLTKKTTTTNMWPNKTN